MRAPSIPSVARALVGWLLLAVILHVIFCNEVQLELLRNGGPEWASLGKWEQRRLAWIHGPLALWATFRLLDGVSLATAFLLCGLLVALGAWRWRQVLREQGLFMGGRDVVRISLIAQFFNAFLLGTAGGDVIKAWYAARSCPNQEGEAAVTVFVDRLLGMLGLLVVAGVLVIDHWHLVRDFQRFQVVALTLLLMLMAALGLLVAGFYTRLLEEGGWISRLARRIPHGSSALRALATCRQFGRRPWFLVRMLALSAAIGIVVALTYVVLARGLGMTVDASFIALVSLSAVCIAALPVTPSGLGVRENLFVWLLSIPGLSLKPGLALSLSLIAYTVNLVWSAIGGLVYLLAADRNRIQDFATKER